MLFKYYIHEQKYIMRYGKLYLVTLDFLLDELTKYQNLMEKFLISQMLVLETDMKEFEIEKTNFLKTNPEYYEMREDELSIEDYDVTIAFPHSFRSSHFTLIISAFENYINHLCNIVGMRKKQLFFADDLAGTGGGDLDKMKKYLEKLEVSFSPGQYEWTFINKCKKLRNLIIHKDCIYKTANEDMVSFVNSQSSLRALPIENLRRGEIPTRFKFNFIDRGLNDTLILNIKSFCNKVLSDANI